MQIDLESGEYEILPPEKPSFFNKLKKYLEIYSKFLNNKGGWKSIIFLCVFFFILSYVFGASDNNLALWASNIHPSIINSNTVVHSIFKTSVENNFYFRWITAIFLHAGFMHLAFNILGAYILGSFLQKIWNSKVVFVIFFLSGLVGSISTFYIKTSNSVGASGGVFGLMGALLAYFWLNKNIEVSIRQNVLKQLGFLLMINLGLGFVIPNIDMVGHLGGFFCGLILSFFIYKANFHKKNRFLVVSWSVILLIIISSFVKVSVVYFQNKFLY